jgi:hypothetical protein
MNKKRKKEGREEGRKERKKEMEGLFSVFSILLF